MESIKIENLFSLLSRPETNETRCASFDSDRGLEISVLIITLKIVFYFIIVFKGFQCSRLVEKFVCGSGQARVNRIEGKNSGKMLSQIYCSAGNIFMNWKKEDS